jgi:hypothetical protein
MEEKSLVCFIIYMCYYQYFTIEGGFVTIFEYILTKIDDKVDAHRNHHERHVELLRIVKSVRSLLPNYNVIFLLLVTYAKNLEVFYLYTLLNTELSVFLNMGTFSTGVHSRHNPRFFFRKIILEILEECRSDIKYSPIENIFIKSKCNTLLVKHLIKYDLIEKKTY